MIVGIDPGFSGAIAFLNENNGDLVIFDLPIRMHAGRKQIDGLAFLSLLLKYPFIRFVAIEDVHAMPHDGVVSAFRFGYNAGILSGVLETLNVKVLKIKPQVWKSALGLDRNKKNSLLLAQEIFPFYPHYFKRKKDEGRAEAALIAHFALKML